MSIFKRKNSDKQVLMKSVYCLVQKIEEQQKQLDFIMDVLIQSGLIEMYKDKQEYVEKHKDEIVKGNC